MARHAGEMIGELTLAMGAKQNIAVLSSTIHPYPTQAEVLRKIGDAYMRTKLDADGEKNFWQVAGLAAIEVTVRSEG